MPNTLLRRLYFADHLYAFLRNAHRLSTKPVAEVFYLCEANFSFYRAAWNAAFLQSFQCKLQLLSMVIPIITVYQNVIHVQHAKLWKRDLSLKMFEISKFKALGLFAMPIGA